MTSRELDPMLFEGLPTPTVGNHDARNVGYLRYEDTFGARDWSHKLQLDGLAVALVAVDSSKPDLDQGEIGREHYCWIEQASPARLTCASSSAITT
jgi:hypothetical protein